jgi:hypothetical protein
MIPDHFELNLAYDGTHYARVVFGASVMETEAKTKARAICHAMTISHGVMSRWQCTLTHITCRGRTVDFE